MHMSGLSPPKILLKQSSLRRKSVTGNNFLVQMKYPLISLLHANIFRDLLFYGKFNKVLIWRFFWYPKDFLSSWETWHISKFSSCVMVGSILKDNLVSTDWLVQSFNSSVNRVTTYADPRIALNFTKSKKNSKKLDSHSTAMHVLNGEDLSGKVAIVTGANSGIG